MGDPALGRVVEAALAHNLDIAAAVARQAEAALFPVVTAVHDHSRSQQPGFFGSFTGTSYSSSLEASYELDLWRRASSSAQAAALEANATAYDLEALVMAVSAQAGELYYLAASLREQEELANRLVQELEEQTRVSQDRYIYGLSPSDLFLDARGRAEAARQRLISIEEQEKEVDHALFLLTGGVLGRPPSPPPKVPFPHGAPPVGLPAGLLQFRPDVSAAYRRVKAADRRVAAALAQFFPTVDLTGRWGRSTTATSFGDITGAFWSAALSAAITILDGGARRARVAEARARTMEALAQYHKAVLSAFKDVEDALSQLATAQRREESLAAEEAAMEQVARLLRDRYDNGLASYDEVMRAQAQLTTVELALAQARYQAAVAVISLYRAVGGAWMEEYLREHWGRAAGHIGRPRAGEE